jgi:hypothetical protein
MTVQRRRTQAKMEIFGSVLRRWIKRERWKGTAATCL